MPNNSKSTWICRSCKGKSRKTNVQVPVVPILPKPPSETSPPSTSLTPQDLTCIDVDDYCVNDLSDTVNHNDLSDDQSYSRNINMSAFLENLTQAEFDVIESPTGWLDCTIIQQAQIILKQVNPTIEGFQRTTLGPVRNFDVVTSEFVQILHTGLNHWVCTSIVGCLPGILTCMTVCSMT